MKSKILNKLENFLTTEPETKMLELQEKFKERGEFIRNEVIPRVRELETRELKLKEALQKIHDMIPCSNQQAILTICVNALNDDNEI